jgi:hypothetical protein
MIQLRKQRKKMAHAAGAANTEVLEYEMDLSEGKHFSEGCPSLLSKA